MPALTKNIKKTNFYLKMSSNATTIKGIYVHIPFCISKCPYCDFISGIPPDENIVEQYFGALKKEILIQSNLYNLEDCETLYFGGGTPSLFPKKLEEVFQLLQRLCPKIQEVTVEINPQRNFNPSHFEFATRVSLGAQTFSPKYLKILGRTHTVQDSITSIKRAVAKFKSTNIDIMFALPGQSPQEHLDDLKRAVDLGANHISAYMLTPYEETPFGKAVKKGMIKLPNDISKFFEVQKFLEDKNFKRYEVSNFAIPNFECRHNLIYWNREDFLGFGLSAWSKIGDTRFSNTKNIKDYISKLSENKLPISFHESLDVHRKIEEIIFLGLRKIGEGIDISQIQKFLDVKGFLESALKRFGKFLELSADKDGNPKFLRLKQKYIYYIDAITVELMILAEKYMDLKTNG